MADELAERLDVLLQAAADRFAEREDALVDDPVVGEVPVFAPGDDSGSLQDAEVLGDVLLRRPDQLGQFEHGCLALTEPVEQLDPGWSLSARKRSAISSTRSSGSGCGIVIPLLRQGEGPKRTRTVAL